MEPKPQEHAADVVSREEYEQLKSRNAELERRVKSQEKKLAAEAGKLPRGESLYRQIMSGSLL